MAADSHLLLDEAADHLAHRRYREAHAACMTVLQDDPENAHVFYLLGVLAADHANHGKALDLFHRAISLSPGNARYLAERARSRVALFDREGAIADAQAAGKAHRLSPRTLDTIGVVHSRLGLHTEAAPFFQRAVDAEPGNASFLYNLGAALQFKGDFSAAEDAFRRALAIDPAHCRAWSSLVLMQRQTSERNDIAALESLFATLTTADDRLHIGHALAKAHEDIGHGEQAMQWLDRAKTLKRQSAPYDMAETSSLFAAAARTTAPTPVSSANTDAPIFIVGLPRTGTTLLDRILSSHSDVASAGELSDFALELKRAAGTPSPYVLDAVTLDAASHLDLATIGKRYIARARRVVGDAPRFVDKMPLNFFYAPLILRALPNARIICLRRNPADTVLSNYRQLFATTFGYYGYAYDLGWTAHYYVQFDRLMAHFKACLPASRFTEVHYEDLVADIEGEARRLVAFSGLSWQDQCLSFHENAAPVATASASQVRRPLYATSINRWRRHRSAMQPALDVLSQSGIVFE
jgi:tetratricopeptide (TPR) repeat protein